MSRCLSCMTGKNVGASGPPRRNSIQADESKTFISDRFLRARTDASLEENPLAPSLHVDMRHRHREAAIWRAADHSPSEALPAHLQLGALKLIIPVVLA